MYTLPETNIAPARRPSQKETSFPSIHFQVQFVSFRMTGMVWHNMVVSTLWIFLRWQFGPWMDWWKLVAGCLEVVEVRFSLLDVQALARARQNLGSTCNHQISKPSRMWDKFSNVLVWVCKSRYSDSYQVERIQVLTLQTSWWATENEENSHTSLHSEPFNLNFWIL